MQTDSVVFSGRLYPYLCLRDADLMAGTNGCTSIPCLLVKVVRERAFVLVLTDLVEESAARHDL